MLSLLFSIALARPHSHGHRHYRRYQAPSESSFESYEHNEQYEQYDSNAKQTYQQLAKTLIQGKKTEKDKAVAIYNYVRDKISYSNYYNSKYYAQGTLDRKYGNCCDQAHLVIQMARSVGLTVNYGHADCYFTGRKAYVGHVFPVFVIDGKSYIADPTSRYNSFGVHKNWSTKKNYKLFKTLPF